MKKIYVIFLVVFVVSSLYSNIFVSSNQDFQILRTPGVSIQRITNYHSLETFVEFNEKVSLIHTNYFNFRTTRYRAANANNITEIRLIPKDFNINQNSDISIKIETHRSNLNFYRYTDQYLNEIYLYLEKHYGRKNEIELRRMEEPENPPFGRKEEPEDSPFGRREIIFDRRPLPQNTYYEIKDYGFINFGGVSGYGVSYITYYYGYEKENVVIWSVKDNKVFELRFETEKKYYNNLLEEILLILNTFKIH